MKLREYQTELINNTRNTFHTTKRCLSVAPCGAGKTIMFAYMCQQHLLTHKNGYVWFLVHRQELIDQTIATFVNNGIPMDNVLIGMVQTISRHLDRYNKPTMIIFDEAHHSNANQWKRIIDTYNDVAIIGLTATPCRLDGKPLGDIYDSMIIGPSVQYLIDNHYLAPYEYYAPHIDLEESKWEIKGSDYNQDSIAKTLDKQAIYGDIVKYIDYNKKTIIYAPNIAYSVKLAQMIGDKCRHFDGDTPKQERKQIIQDFRDGKIRVLTNVDLIGEGFDCPDCDCVMLLRPTMSTSLFIQQSMRCMRYQLNKTAVIYDFVGNVYRHGLPSDEREWSLTKAIKKRARHEVEDVLVRECKHCFLVYKGNGRICPYCHQDNGKTKKQIEEEKQAELERIESLQKKQERREVGMCRDMDSLVELAIKRGYKNPVWFARKVLEGRQNRV